MGYQFMVTWFYKCVLVYIRKGGTLYILQVKTLFQCISIEDKTLKKSTKNRWSVSIFGLFPKLEVAKSAHKSTPKIWACAFERVNRNEVSLEALLNPESQELGQSYSICRLLWLVFLCALQSDSFPVFGQDREKLGTHEFDVVFIAIFYQRSR